jgi:hypothetical protein
MSGSFVIPLGSKRMCAKLQGEQLEAACNL